MTIVLELNKEQEARLRDQANALGLAPADFLNRIAELDALPEPQDETFAGERFAGKTLADLLGDSVGVVDSAEYFGGKPSGLSTRTGKAFGEMLHKDSVQDDKPFERVP